MNGRGGLKGGETDRVQGKERRGGERGGGRGEGREGICAKYRTCGKLCEPVENYPAAGMIRAL